MPLKLSEAEEDGISSIADIHMAAFSTNATLHAQFPTPGTRYTLKATLKEKAVGEIRDPQWPVLIVRDEGTNEIISFARWRRPIPESKLESYVEAPWSWPMGTVFAVLKEWTEKVESANKKILGSTPCYSLSCIATDPQHERRGAASMLINWGLERGKREGVPVALESTKNAWPLYEKLGFRGEKHISMALEAAGGGASVLYEEMCFVFRPDVASSAAKDELHMAEQ